jgi:excisionase family DNA binding protein
LETVELDADELEAVSLCDRDAMTQAEAGEQMGVSRGTVQRLVTSGRKKVIDALLSGHALLIKPHEHE